MVLLLSLIYFLSIAKPANRQSLSATLFNRFAPFKPFNRYAPFKSFQSSNENNLVPVGFEQLERFDPLQQLKRLELLERLERAFVIVRLSAADPSVKRARWYPTFGGGVPRDRSRTRLLSRCVSLRQT